MFDQYQKNIRSMPDKKDREEIETLKKQVSLSSGYNMQCMKWCDCHLNLLTVVWFISKN